MKAGEWFVLRQGNDWGRDYLARLPHAKSGTASADRGYRLVTGETITVRLTNGDERAGVVQVKHTHQTVGDHGKDYSVTSEVPFVAFDDGTEAQLTKVAIQYDPDRDPVASED